MFKFNGAYISNNQIPVYIFTSNSNLWQMFKSMHQKPLFDAKSIFLFLDLNCNFLVSLSNNIDLQNVVFERIFTFFVILPLGIAIIILLIN